MTHPAAALTAAPAPAALAPSRTMPALASARVGVGLALLAVLVFANAVGNGFVLDDRGIIANNPLVHDLPGVWRAFALPYWPEALGGGQYRPLGIVSFALDWTLGGAAPAWFHAVNVAWHAAATLLVWRVALALVSSRAALLAAAFFAVHPVHVEAVANVVGRLELMATVFALGALLAHRAGSWFALPLFALGLLSKENAIVTVALIAVHDVAFRDRRSARSMRLYAGYGVIAVLYALALALVFDGRSLGVTTGSLTDASAATRFWTVLTVIPHYVRLLLFPAALSADYEPQVIPAAHGVTTDAILGTLLLLVYGAAVAWSWRRERVLAVALLWIAIAIAPVANVFFVSGVTLAERSLYLPSVGVVIALGMAGDLLLTRRRTAALALSAMLLAAGAWRTFTRTPVWRDDRSYLLRLLEDHPESYRAHWMAGRVHRAAGRMDDAAHEFDLARRLFAGSAALYTDAAALAEARGDTRLAAALRDSAAVVQRR